MQDEIGIIEENINISDQYYLIKIKSEYISTNSQPGNFIMLEVSPSHDPLLRRPFGIFKSQPPYIWLYYEIVGRGTKLLSQMKKNDHLKILGPLGNYFPQFDNKVILMIAGGRGIAPIFYALHEYTGNNNVFLIYGARSKNSLNLLNKINDFPIKKFFLYTEDGSFGKTGRVTDEVNDIIDNNEVEITFSCGPELMLQALSQKLPDSQTTDYASLEALMGCGIGICHSCIIKNNKNEYLKICHDGPILKLDEIIW